MAMHLRFTISVAHDYIPSTDIYKIYKLYNRVEICDFCRRSQNKQTKRLVCEFFFKNSGIGNDRNSTYLVIQTDTVTPFKPL